MKDFVPCRCVLRTILCSFSALAFAFATTTAALAQHAGGHVGGAGHLSAPAASRPAPVAVPHPVAPVAPVRPPLPRPATHSFLVKPPVIPPLTPPSFRVGQPFPHHPILPRRPILPIFPVPPSGFGAFGIPFFWGFGWGFAPTPWLGCVSYWSWPYACNELPAYQEYGPPPLATPLAAENPLPPAEVQYWPVYFGEPNSQYVQLFLDDGTAYNVTDYWLEKGELHFKTVEEQGTKVVEHTIDFDRLDLQKTIDVNTDRGFRFVLRNEPIEQYLKDHSSSEPPEEAPPVDQQP